MFLVAGLPATFLLRLASFGGCGRACGCCVLGGSEEFCGVLPFACRSNASILRFQFRVVRQQRANDRLGFRRLASNDFFSDSRRHATVVAECRRPCPDQFIENRAPGCERLPLRFAKMARFTELRKERLGLSRNLRPFIN